jgi:hypothetical protein
MNEGQFEIFRARLSGVELVKTAVIVGSGPAAPAVGRWLTDETIVIAINNAHAAVPRLDFSVYADDFPAERKHPQAGRLGRSGPQYIPAMERFGGPLFGGATMAMAAGYWAIENLPNSQINFFACDMVYDGPQSHFYGAGAADPLRPDASLQSLQAKSLRLFYCGLTCGSLLLNASDQTQTRLALPRLAAGRALARPLVAEVQAEMKALVDALRPLAASALARERAVPFDATYRKGVDWSTPEVWQACAEIDALWLELARPVAGFETVLARHLD